MYKIKSYYVACYASDILENGSWTSSDYWELYDGKNTDIEKLFYNKENAENEWKKCKYYVSEFDGYYDMRDVPCVSVKMYALCDNNDKIIKQSNGTLFDIDIYLWFPELKED